MAWIDVPAPPAPEGNFFKFNAIGDTLAGFFQGTKPSGGQYGGTDVMVKDRQGVMQTATIKSALEAQVKAAIAQGLAPGCKVLIKFVGEKPTDKGNPMKLFQLKFEPLGSAPAQQSAPPPPPKPAAPAQQPWPTDDGTPF